MITDSCPECEGDHLDIQVNSLKQNLAIVHLDPADRDP